MKKAAVLLSGCGNMDGSEIHESVSVITALDLAGWEIVYTAPDIQQAKTLSYISGTAISHRNALEEAARIARGRIEPLDHRIVDIVDAIVIPGGLGAALTLCDFALKGAGCSAHPEVLELLQEAYRHGKPIAAMCIAPALVARCISGATVTIGTDRETALKIRGMGGFHTECGTEEALVDHRNKIITTPAYMTAKGPGEVFRGALKLVEELDRMISED